MINREMVCDCGINLMLLILLPLTEQTSEFDIEDALVERELDYLCYSSRSIPSID